MILFFNLLVQPSVELLLWSHNFLNNTTPSGALDALKKCSFLIVFDNNTLLENNHVQKSGKYDFGQDKSPCGVVPQQNKGRNHIPDPIRTHFCINIDILY